MKAVQDALAKTMMTTQQLLPGIALIAMMAAAAAAQDATDYVPDPGTFAPIAKARYLSGELVYIDPVNRRGAIRMHDNYWSGPAHYFALLSYLDSAIVACLRLKSRGLWIFRFDEARFDFVDIDSQFQVFLHPRFRVRLARLGVAGLIVALV